jgi:hypothetical protein
MPQKTPLVRALLILGTRLGPLDEWAHRLHLPDVVLHPICDAWDWHLGVYDDDELPLEHWTEGGHGLEGPADSGADCKDLPELPSLAWDCPTVWDQPC